MLWMVGILKKKPMQHKTKTATTAMMVKVAVVVAEAMQPFEITGANDGDSDTYKPFEIRIKD